MCDVTLLASRMPCRKQATISTACREGGSAGNITSQIDTLCLFTRHQGSGRARTLTDGISHQTKVSAIPHDEGCGAMRA